ncbi:tetratricopeptide repeat protein 1-like [Papaver somniferum]|uniref:tetratricopeptide repeat protein 1-like n=1 Tax=Papaver somniferum TaxID=3469 RepID=UPI000E6F75FA|nr:tetratricopeptide repeat protein 1-like [Papaver somniferum]
MVIIESAPNGGEDEDTSTQINVVESNSSSIKSTEETNNDGFETASEGDGAREEEEEEPVLAPSPSNEELQQKALSEANDAKTEGNKLFGSAQYEDALLRYELALQIAADMPASIEIRSICHANRAACFSNSGRYEETIKECNKALELNPAYMKALIRRGEAHEKLEHFEEAVIDMKKIVELDPSNNQARRSIVRLEPLAAEKREKMKEQMIGKQKEMGNSVLGRFGMSIDNFKAVKDPTTGSYSLSFQK